MPQDAKKQSSTAVVWDPVCPARLLVLGGAEDAAARMNYLWSHTGASSCNKHEKSALIKIIQAHDYYHERLDKEVMAAQPSKVFSRQ